MRVIGGQERGRKLAAPRGKNTRPATVRVRASIFSRLVSRNAIAGVHMPAIAVPRATYTGWNPRAEGYGAGALYPLQGAVVPFAPTEAARKEVHDPRPSIAERYANDDAYVEAVRKEAARGVSERLLLPEDAERAVEAAHQGTLAKLGD